MATDHHGPTVLPRLRLLLLQGKRLKHGLHNPNISTMLALA